MVLSLILVQLHPLLLLCMKFSALTMDIPFFLTNGNLFFLNRGVGEKQPATKQDPVEGFIFGGNSGSCLVPTEEPLHPTRIFLKGYPNPAKEYLQVRLNATQSGNHASFRILNPLGKIMLVFESDNFQTDFIIPLKDWAVGMYFLQYLEDGEVRATERFVVARI